MKNQLRRLRLLEQPTQAHAIIDEQRILKEIDHPPHSLGPSDVAWVTKADSGVVRMLAQVLIAEADAFVALWKDLKLPDGRTQHRSLRSTPAGTAGIPETGGANTRFLHEPNR